MSLDFPNRADWLAVRKQTPVQKRYTHLSVDGGRAFTFKAGRNAEKVSTGKGWFKGVTSDIGSRYKARAGEIGHKYNTHDRVSLLADRRLRQRAS